MNPKILERENSSTSDETRIQPDSDLSEQILQLKQGDHLCLIYDKDPAEQMPALIPFIREGLSNQEQFIYIADDQTVEQLTYHLKKSGIDVEGEVNKGTLKLWTRKEWRQNGALDSDQKSSQVQKFIDEAFAAGFKGIRFAVEMTWTLGPDISSHQLEHWEATINTIFVPGFPGRIICQYNRSRLPPETTLAALHTHPIVILNDQVCPNPFYRAPLILKNQKNTPTLPSQKIDWMVSQLKQTRSVEKQREELNKREADCLREQIAVELTHRKRSDQNLEDFFENATMGLHCAGPDGIILKANRFELEMLGYPREEYIGHHISEFHADQDVITDILNQLAGGHILEDYPARLKCKDGSIKQVLINSSVLWENGKFINTRCFTRDVTKQKEDEAFRRHLAAIVESSDDAIVGKDLNSVITSWNKGAERLFGYTPEEVIGKYVTILMPPDRRKEEPKILQQIKVGQRIEHYETIRRRKDGTLFDVSISVSPIKDDQGKIIGAAKIARDVTESKRLQEELARSNNELEQFAHVASHDLQEPLHMVSSFVGLLARRCKDKLDEKEMEYLKFIQQGAVQAKTLIKELLDYSSIGKDKTLSVVSLKTVLREVEANLQAAIAESKAEIHYNGVPDVKAHHLEMVQLFQNLIANAIKYRKDTPIVDISCSKQPNGKWLFAVKDNGIGIDPQHSNRVFGMFERLHSSSEYSGTGIGLAICKRVVERHGGKIWLESERGQGTTFYFTINVN